jgi:uncharacterized Zn finger protein
MENQQVRVGLENSTAIVCEKCENSTFKEASYLRKISRLLTGSAEDMIVPVPTFICTACGHVNEQFQIREPKKPDTIIK